jgi:hypothetical protein
MQVVCTVSGSGAFGMLRFESGVHRVQRVCFIFALGHWPMLMRQCPSRIPGTSHRKNGARAHFHSDGGGAAGASGERSSN